jgi:hypothetical protein
VLCGKKKHQGVITAKAGMGAPISREFPSSLGALCLLFQQTGHLVLGSAPFSLNGTDDYPLLIGDDQPETEVEVAI